MILYSTKLIDEKQQILETIENWLRFYGNSKEKANKSIKPKLLALLELDINTITLNDIKEIVGTNYFPQTIYCDECGEQFVKTIQLGEEPGYDARTVNICENCLKKALELISGKKYV